MFMHTERPRRTGVLVTLLLAAMGGGVAPRAQAVQAVAEVRVSIADLNLATATGEREFRQRVGAAVRRVCAAEHGVAAHRNLERQHTCRRQAWNGVRAQLAASGRAAPRPASRN